MIMKRVIFLLSFFFAILVAQAQQPTTMITTLSNGAAIRTDVSEVEKITFADTTYNLNNNGYRILESDELCWPEDRLLPLFLPPLNPVKALDISVSSFTDAERVMFCALQGLVNRNRPRLLLYNHNEEPRDTWTNAHALSTSTVTASTAYNLIKTYKNEINGLVLYSTQKSNHYANLASTIAGLDRLLPVTAEIQSKLAARRIDLPVLVDLTSLTMTNTRDVYNYLYENYWSRCNHRLIISERPNIPYVHDIGVAAGSACLWLDPRVEEESKLLDKFLKDLTPGRDFVLGWFPEERSGVGATTKYGLSTVPADFFENATVYTAVNRAVKIPPVPKRPKLEKKIYAAVYISDGDNIQYCQHAMAKIFNQGGRGQMPMNWTISPSLVDIAPMMLNYYYRKATDNDCFVSGPSGMGYAMPYDAHNSCYYVPASSNKIVPYTQLTQRYIEKAGLRVITIWDDISTVQRKRYADNCPYLYGLTINDWERQEGRLTMKVQSGWLPIAVQYPCYASGTNVITGFFNRDITNFNGSKPMFVCGQVTVWDVGPDKLVSLKTELDALSPGNVNIVRADHWFSYYNEANHLPFNLSMLEDTEVTSSAVAAGSAVENATNGSPSDGYQWVSGTTDGTGWVQLDFKEPFKISRYVVRHAEAGGLAPQLNNRDFTVETSLDGETWTEVGTYTGNLSPVTEASITPVEAQYFRVSVTKSGIDGRVRIGDIEVYGKR